MTIEEKLAAAEALVASASAERDDLRSTVEKLTVGTASEAEALKVEAASKDAKLAELTSALEASAKEASELKAKVAELEAGKVSASEEAAKIAASVGVAPVETNPAADAAPKADVLETYLALSGQERAAFFAANRAAIMGALRK